MMLAHTIANFPSQRLSRETEIAWAEVLLPLDHDFTLEAIRELARYGTPFGRPFHISDVVRRSRELERQWALDHAGDIGRELEGEAVPFDDWLESNPEWKARREALKTTPSPKDDDA